MGRGLVVALAIGLVAAVAPGCASTRSMFGSSGVDYTMSTSPKLPATQGKVHVAKQSDGNLKVEVKAEHLAPPDRAFPEQSHYVVWIEPDHGGPAVNMGMLKVGDDLKADFSTTTSFRDFEVVVTAEADPTVTTPSGQRALSANIHVPS